MNNNINFFPEEYSNYINSIIKKKNKNLCSFFYE